MVGAAAEGRASADGMVVEGRPLAVDGVEMSGKAGVAVRTGARMTRSSGGVEVPRNNPTTTISDSIRHNTAAGAGEILTRVTSGEEGGSEGRLGLIRKWNKGWIWNIYGSAWPGMASRAYSVHKLRVAVQQPQPIIPKLRATLL